MEYTTNSTGGTVVHSPIDPTASTATEFECLAVTRC